jgi:hypothetical protein
VAILARDALKQLVQRMLLFAQGPVHQGAGFCGNLDLSAFTNSGFRRTPGWNSQRQDVPPFCDERFYGCAM